MDETVKIFSHKKICANKVYAGQTYNFGIIEPVAKKFLPSKGLNSTSSKEEIVAPTEFREWDMSRYQSPEKNTTPVPNIPKTNVIINHTSNKKSQVKDANNNDTRLNLHHQKKKLDDYWQSSIISSPKFRRKPCKFNIDKASPEIKEKLKQIYVY